MGSLDDLLLPWSIELSLHHELPEPCVRTWRGWAGGWSPVERRRCDFGWQTLIGLSECLTICPPLNLQSLLNLVMRVNQTLLRLTVVGALIAAASLPVRAAVITYTDRDAFLAALSSSSTDNYDDLTSGFHSTPLSRSIPGYAYNAVASNGLFVGSVGGSQALSTIDPEDLTLAIQSGAPTAVGGYFFNNDFFFQLINGVITVTANPGASTQSTVTASATNFFGWLDDSGTPFTSLVITPSSGAYPTVDNLILGQAGPASVPVPGPLPLLGAAAAFRVSRRLRSRIAAAGPGV